MARERLAALDREIAEAERALAEAEASTEAGGLVAPVAPVPARPPRKRAAPAHRPYRVFRASGGQPIWVGRAGEDNAVLTFRVARPHHLWMHARGVPGRARGRAARPGRGGRAGAGCSTPRTSRCTSRGWRASHEGRWPGRGRDW